jgi:hypothetical protein
MSLAALAKYRKPSCAWVGAGDHHVQAQHGHIPELVVAHTWRRKEKKEAANNKRRKSTAACGNPPRVEIDPPKGNIKGN